MQDGTTSVADGGQFLEFVKVLWKVVKKMDAATLEGWLKYPDGLFKVLSETLLFPIKFLKITSRVWMSARPAVTTSEEYFKEAGIGLIDGNFKTQFLGFEIPAVPETQLAVRKLEQASPDACILVELGDKAEIAISQFKAFLNGNRGSKERFIFYLKGLDGKFWTVHAHWGTDCGGDWHVDAYSVAYPRGWDAGVQVLSQA